MLTLIFILLLFIYGIISGIKNKREVLSYENTNTLKGIAVLGVFIYHSTSWYLSNDFIDNINLGSICVTIFFFLSGYGLFESFKKRSTNSTKIELYKWVFIKILKIIEVVFILFLPSLVILQISGAELNITIISIIKRLVKLNFFGTANWYIKIQIVCYVLFAIVYFKDTDKKKYLFKNIIIFLLLSILIYILYKAKYEMYWYNTVYSFLIGIILSIYKEKVFNKLNTTQYILCCIMLFILITTGFLMMVNIKDIFSILYLNVFAILIIMLNYKLPINNNFMIKFSNISLEFYLIHIVIFHAMRNVEWNSNLEILITFILSIIISYFCYKIKNIKISNIKVKEKR